MHPRYLDRYRSWETPGSPRGLDHYRRKSRTVCRRQCLLPAHVRVYPVGTYRGWKAVRLLNLPACEYSEPQLWNVRVNVPFLLTWTPSCPFVVTYATGLSVHPSSLNRISDSRNTGRQPFDWSSPPSMPSPPSTARVVGTGHDRQCASRGLIPIATPTGIVQQAAITRNSSLAERCTSPAHHCPELRCRYVVQKRQHFSRKVDHSSN